MRKKNQMKFNFSEEHLMIQKSARDFAQQELLPGVIERDELQKFLESKNIQSLIYYGTPLHLHKASKILGYKKGDFKMAEELCDKVISFPHHQYLSEEQIKFVSDSINLFYN